MKTLHVAVYLMAIFITLQKNKTNNLDKNGFSFTFELICPQCVWHLLYAQKQL